MGPTALPPRRAVHRPCAVAQRLLLVPSEQGALPARSRRVTAVRRMIAAAGAVAVLAACGDGASSSPSSTSSRDPASAPHSTPTGPTPTDSAPSERGSSPGQVGDPQHPVALTPGDDPLQWRPVAGPTEDLVTVGGGWTLTVPENGPTASLAGPHPRTVPAGAHARI